MTRLELAQRVQALLRAATGALGTTPTVTTSQTGVEGEIVRFVDMAYSDIQAEQELWRFMTKRGSFNTVVGTRVYTVSSSVSDYEKMLPTTAGTDQRYITHYTTATGVGDEIRTWFVPYDEWRQGVFDMGTRPQARPVRFTIEPDGQIALDPNPDAVYTMVFDYRRTPHAMTADAHEPLFPARFHDAIVMRALKLFALTRDGMGEFRAKIEDELRGHMTRLRYDQLPTVVFDEIA